MTERLIEANLDARVDAVFEMAGGEVFRQSYQALAPFGRLVVYGRASGEPNEVDSGQLMRSSRAVVGFWLVHCLARPDMVAGPLAELFGLAASAELRAVVGATYPLANAAQAHRDLAARTTTGKLLLDPNA
jgi:NADPH2:quinone reductase